MTKEETQKLKAIILATNMYYGRELRDDVLLMQVSDLADLSFDAVAQAYVNYRRNPKNRQPPLPADILEAVNPGNVVSPEQDAVEASNRIIQAMTRYGWTNPDRAREFIGELGWMIVEREGGWRDLCERTTNDDLPILKAQWRELAKALRSRAEAGKLDKAPRLISDERRQIQNIANQALKRLT